MTSIWLFACYEIIRLNQRFCEVLFVNVLKEVRNILTFLLARKSLFKPSISRELYRRVTCCPPTTLITIEISVKLMSRLSEALSWVKGGRNGHKAHLQPFTNSLLIDLSLSIFEKKKHNVSFIKIFFYFSRLEAFVKSCRQILPFISNNWYIKRDKTIEISNKKFPFKSRQGNYAKNIASRR